MKILFIGDIVGRPGREILKEYLRRNRNFYDIVIVNGENASGGKGLTDKTLDELLYMGVDVITLGDHTWDRKEILKVIEHPSVVRPLNFPEDVPGKGFVEIKGLYVVNLLGRVFMKPIDCPFRSIGKFLEKINSKNVIVDFHAEATSEKVALGWYLDGRVVACFGTHTHIPTRDLRILPKGTCYITDVGMTGSYDSCIGVKKELILKHFLTGMPVKFEIAERDVRLYGVSLEVENEEIKNFKMIEFQESEI